MSEHPEGPFIATLLEMFDSRSFPNIPLKERMRIAMDVLPTLAAKLGVYPAIPTAVKIIKDKARHNPDEVFDTLLSVAFEALSPYGVDVVVMGVANPTGRRFSGAVSCQMPLEDKLKRITDIEEGVPAELVAWCHELRAHLIKKAEEAH